MEADSIEKAQLTSYSIDLWADLLALIPTNVKRVLDIGCGAGYLGRSLKDNGVSYVAGVELNPTAAASRGFLDLIVEGDVELIGLPFEKESFDCIIFDDIIEHLRDPVSVLTRSRKYLKPDRVIICSIPNVRHYKIIWGLLLGKWKYQEEGLLDKTHRYFFTRKSIEEMMSGANLKILRLDRRSLANRFMRILNRLLLNALHDFVCFQYKIMCTHNHKARIPK